MDIIIKPTKLRGTVAAIPSKSQAHRLLICAAFAEHETRLRCPDTNRDIEATADCLRALGAEILRDEGGYTVFPVQSIPQSAALPCHDSGSTLRFLLPVIGALGIRARIRMHGRLPERPLEPLAGELTAHGMTLTRPAVETERRNPS